MTQGRVEKRRISVHGPRCSAAFINLGRFSFRIRGRLPWRCSGLPYRHRPLETVSAASDRLRRPLGPGSLAAFSLASRGAQPVTSDWLLRAGHHRIPAGQGIAGPLCYRWRNLCASSSISSGVHLCGSSDRRTGMAVSWYNSCASAGGPRRAPSPVTRTVRRKAPCGTAIVSPIRIVWLPFLTATVLTATAPAAQRRAPRERLFTRRANHSH